MQGDKYLHKTSSFRQINSSVQLVDDFGYELPSVLEIVGPVESILTISGKDT